MGGLLGNPRTGQPLQVVFGEDVQSQVLLALLPAFGIYRLPTVAGLEYTLRVQVLHIVGLLGFLGTKNHK